MKTPKEKAQELIEKFKPYTHTASGITQMEHAKQCALICVNEFISFADENWNEDNWSKDQESAYDYWTNVTREIETP